MDQHLPFEYSNQRCKHTKNTHRYLFAKILNVVKLTKFLPIEPRWCSLFTFWLTTKLGTLPEGVQPSGRAPSFPLEACKMGEPLAAMVGPSMSQLDHALTNMYRDTMRLIEIMHYHWKHIFMNGCIGILYSWMCMCIAAPRLSGHMMGETWLFLQERDSAKIIFISSFFILCHFSQRYAKMTFLWQHQKQMLNCKKMHISLPGLACCKISVFHWTKFVDEGKFCPP